MKIVLKKGDAIGFYKEPIPRIVMVRSIENQDVVGHRGWAGTSNNDDKVIAELVKDEGVFQSFLLIISEMVGFKYKLKKTRYGVAGIILNDVYCE